MGIVLGAREPWTPLAQSCGAACQQCRRAGAGRRVGNLRKGGGAARPGEAPARPGRGSHPFPGCRAALGPLSVCWQEAPAHAVLVNIQTRDFSQSKSTSTFFENLPKNSKRREFLALSPCRRRSKFATKEVLGKGIIVFPPLFKECEIFAVGGGVKEERVAETARGAFGFCFGARNFTFSCLVIFSF